MSFRIIISILAFLLLSFTSYCQERLKYDFEEKEIEYGFTLGYGILFANLELSATVSKRVSNALVLSAEPLVGFLRQAHLFEGNEDRYFLPYAGGEVGLNLGPQNKFFELSLGLAYLYDKDSSWDGAVHKTLPLLSLAYKNSQSDSMTYSLGVGFPHGLFLSFHY